VQLYQYNRSSTLMSAYRHLRTPRFRSAVIHEKAEVYKALRTFFTAEADTSGGDAV